MLKKALLSVLCLTALSACGGGSDSSNSETQTIEQKFQQLEKEGVMPILDRTDTIKGIDADNNGIRDDIQEFIKTTYPEISQQNAVNQFAKEFQDLLLVDYNDSEALRIQTEDYLRGLGCIFEHFEDDLREDGVSVSGEIVSLTTNTKERLKAYLELDEAYDGYVFNTAPLKGNCND